MDFWDSVHLYRHLVKEDRRTIDDYKKQSSNNSHGRSCLYNWWKSGAYLWFTKRYHNILEETGKSFNLCSVFGKRKVLDQVTGIKVFFSGENVHFAPYDEYSDYLLTDKTTDLALGFEYFEDNRYLRFPLWLLYMFNPTSTQEEIISRCNALRYPSVSEKSRFCGMIASHDPNGLRKVIVKEVEKIAPVSCAGKYLHNDDSLKTQYGDDKIDYLKSFCFNICPENSNSYGYVTEKVFEAISAGCIPIYWGSYNNPEPQIINPDAVVFWNKDQDNADALQMIHQLYSQTEEMDKFLHQPRLKNGAEDVVWGMFQALDSAILRVLES